MIQDIVTSDCVYMGGDGLIGKIMPAYACYKKLLKQFPDSVWMSLTNSKYVNVRIYAYEALKEKNESLADAAKSKLGNDSTIFCFHFGCIQDELSVKDFFFHQPNK